jgi:hypothetical protein
VAGSRGEHRRPERCPLATKLVEGAGAVWQFENNEPKLRQFPSQTEGSAKVLPGLGEGSADGAGGR